MSGSTILIVEDEPDLQSLLSFNLSESGYDVIVASNAKKAFQAVKEEHIDLILLDLMLPDLSGTDVCKRLKQDSETNAIPIIMLTAKGEEVDRVVGFELGADDYVVKPFSLRELSLRIRAILRRSEGPGNADGKIEFGKLRIDRDAHKIWVESSEVILTALEFKLLIILYDRKGRVLTRDILLDEVWGVHADVTSRNVDTHVKRVREKLGIEVGDYIETVRGVGYRFCNELILKR